MKAETDKLIAKINADARLSAAKLIADADLYKAELDAKGSLLEKEASAEGERLKAEAYNAPGGQNLVALTIAETIQLNELVVSTQGDDFLDINQMVKKFGANDGALQP